MNSRLLVGVFLLAGLAGATAYYVTMKPGAVTSPSTTADATTEPATGTDDAAGSAPGASQLAATIPAFQLADRDGVMRSLKDDWAGKALIVNFWATWCAPCRREIPLLKQLAADHAGENFQVVGIAVDFRDKVLAYAREMQIDYPMLIGEQEALDAAAAFGVDALGLPFTIFTDTGGRVIALHMGELTAAEADIILGAVREVNAGRSDPAQARVAIETGLAALPPTHDAEGA
jgi:thiol-disulfide isomerase/thioredoxin